MNRIRGIRNAMVGLAVLSLPCLLLVAYVGLLWRTFTWAAGF